MVQLGFSVLPVHFNGNKLELDDLVVLQLDADHYYIVLVSFNLIDAPPLEEFLVLFMVGESFGSSSELVLIQSPEQNLNYVQQLEFLELRECGALDRRQERDLHNFVGLARLLIKLKILW